MNWTGNLPFNWFDLTVVLMLVVGYTRGKKNGMSQESPSRPEMGGLGRGDRDRLRTARSLGGVHFENRQTLRLPAFLLPGGFRDPLRFRIHQRTLGEKLKGSDAFGQSGIYLAMPAGMLRFACITLFLLALLNARYYTTAEVKAMNKYQNDNYGSNFFPTLSSVQDDVFTKSFLGKQIKEHMSFLLIKPTAPVPARKRRARHGQAQERVFSRCHAQRVYLVVVPA